MTYDFGKYLKSYMDSGQGDDGDPVDEVSPLLRLNLDCLYYNIDYMVKFTTIINIHQFT